MPNETEITQPPKPSWMSDHAAVLIVFTAFCLLLGVYIMELHWSGNDSVIIWLQNKMSDLLSAMLMGLTGAAITARNGGGK